MNVEDKNQTNDNKEVLHKSTAIISEELEQTVPNSATIRSPFTKHNPNESQSPAKSPDRASMDSIKSNASVFKADKYVPKNYCNKTKRVFKENTFKLVHLDWNELNSCAVYSRFIVIFISLLIIIIIILDLNATQTKDNQLVNELKSNMTFEKKIIKPISEIIEMNSKFYFIIICGIGIIVETLIILSYSYHIVENFPRFPWLCLESVYAIVFAVHFFMLSIWMAFYGLWFLIVSIIGIINGFIYTIWALIKTNRYCKGLKAQKGTDDPDGDTLRRMSPNLKFSDPKADEFRLTLLNEKKLVFNQIFASII